MTAAPAARRRRTLSVRWRLTLMYSLLFAACGLVLLTLVYLLVFQSQQPQLTYSSEDRGTPPPGTDPPAPSFDQQAAPENLVRDVLSELLRWSLVALAGMSGLSVLVGWYIAGRVLAPVHAITARAQAIPADALDERIGLDGRADELREMADTFDGLLDRVQESVESEKRLVATMSHELRTPLANQQAVLEVALDGPPEPEHLRNAAQLALDQSRRASRTIEALLLLARAQNVAHPNDRPRGSVDLTAVVCEAVATVRSPDDGLDWSVDIADGVTVTGDEVLLQRAVVNLLENAARYNRLAGAVVVSLTGRRGRWVLVVENTGDHIEVGAAQTLTLPFRRGASDRIDSAGSVGLGLSIVQAIAEHHGASLRLTPRHEGGLEVQLGFAG